MLRDGLSGMASTLGESRAVRIFSCSGSLGCLFTPWEAYRKVNHFRSNLLWSTSIISGGGRCSYAKSRPVIALEIRLTLSGVQAGFLCFASALFL